jgi:hypothetical protein
MAHRNASAGSGTREVVVGDPRLAGAAVQHLRFMTTVWREHMSTPTDSRSVILAGARTPIGKYGGTLSSLTAADLGAVAICAALERAQVPPETVE